jgi:Right handed beta helix region
MTMRCHGRWIGPGLLILAIGPGCDRSPRPRAVVEAAQVRAISLADAVASAQPGDTIVLPTGTYEGGVTLPPRVSLRGAGYRKTILDARKAEVGLAIEGGEGAEVSDLTVWGASKTDLLVVGATGVSLRRLRTTGGLNGVNFADVTSGRIENVISDDNRYGIVVSGGRDNAVVNCTLAGNSSLGLSFPSGAGTVAFNNCIAEGVTGVYLGASAQGVRLDYNLYFSLFVGKLAGQSGRKTLADWQTLSGQDAHSVQLPVAFRDPPKGDYSPEGTLPWSLDRGVAADWGTAELAGVKAPEADLAGTPRAGRVDVGAFEVGPTPSPPRPADGLLTIHADAGVKSAGLFAPDGREVVLLFQDLPLPAGKIPFWLPPRDVQGRPIAAGTYELRTAERGSPGDPAVVRKATAYTIMEPAARALAALPAPPPRIAPRPAPPTVRVHRLAGPMAIDGDLEKWRKAGVAPQIIVTAETATGAIDGPNDIGALIRLAYHGDALYLQVLTFDDAPSFHQPVGGHRQQDGVELCINGFPHGFTFDITRTIDVGPIVFRRRLDAGNLDLLIPADHAPRVVKALPNSRDVPERRLIESIYGVDMADSPLIVTECKLPIDAATYKDAVKDLFPLKSGRTFRVGFVIRDSDAPGTDVRNFLVWPATFGDMNPIDDSAIAVLE